MNNLMRAIFPAILLLAALSASCASAPPLRYYTLQKMNPLGDKAPSVPSSGRIRPLTVESVQIPPELDRQEIVTHAGDYQVRISDEARWAAPLEDQIRRALWADLTARLPPGSLSDPIAVVGDQKDARLLVNVQQFYMDTACRTTLQAVWVIREQGSDQQPTSGSETIQYAGAGSCNSAAQDAAGGMSQALGQFADRLAVAITRWSDE